MADQQVEYHHATAFRLAAARRPPEIRLVRNAADASRDRPSRLARRARSGAVSCSAVSARPFRGAQGSTRLD